MPISNYLTDRVVTKDDPKPCHLTAPECIKVEKRTHLMRSR
jgi:hypothetical protein